MRVMWPRSVSKNVTRRRSGGEDVRASARPVAARAAAATASHRGGAGSPARPDADVVYDLSELMAATTRLRARNAVTLT